MNRELNFRAWDTQRKMFVPDGEICFSFYGDTNIEVHPNCLEYVGDSCHNGEPQRSRFIVSQFTGLLDKNGNEIYEGDIVVVNGLKGFVKYLGCSFMIEWIGADVYSDLLGWDDYKRGQISHGKDYEVIGNIYEDATRTKSTSE